MRCEFVKQPRVLDGDDGLGGEILYQCNLLIGEWADFRAKKDKCTDKIIVLEHRYAEKSSAATGFDESYECGDCL